MHRILLQIRNLKENYQRALKNEIYFSFEPHVIRMSLESHSYVMDSYVTRMYSYVICMSFVFRNYDRRELVT